MKETTGTAYTYPTVYERRSDIFCGERKKQKSDFGKRSLI